LHCCLSEALKESLSALFLFEQQVKPEEKVSISLHMNGQQKKPTKSKKSHPENNLLSAYSRPIINLNIGLFYRKS